MRIFPVNTACRLFKWIENLFGTVLIACLFNSPSQLWHRLAFSEPFLCEFFNPFYITVISACSPALGFAPHGHKYLFDATTNLLESRQGYTRLRYLPVSHE